MYPDISHEIPPKLSLSSPLSPVPLLQVTQLADLIDEINKEQTSLDRKKLITLCTIDVHARDVLTRLIEERVEDGMCFQWQSQLRYSQSEKTKACQVRGREPDELCEMPDCYLASPSPALPKP